MSAGRLPRADRADEAFITTSAAERGHLEVGQHLRFRLASGTSSPTVPADVTVVGIGTLPVEAVADQTMVFGIVVFTRAFYDAHRDLAVYAVSNVDLEAGVDARRDLAPRAGELGFRLQSARSQERQSVERAVRPLVIVLAALGVLSFAATTMAAALFAARGRARNTVDDSTLFMIGMTRGQVRLVELMLSGAIAAVAVVVALAVMALAPAIAPLGPLHDLDPARGFFLDGVVAPMGAAAIIAGVILFLSVVTSSVRRRSRRPWIDRPRWLTSAPRSPSAIAGVALALWGEDGRARPWRGIGATTAIAALVALSATFLASAVALSDTPARYGFDADLVALNAYGDQSTEALATCLRRAP